MKGTPCNAPPPGFSGDRTQGHLVRVPEHVHQGRGSAGASLVLHMPCTSGRPLRTGLLFFLPMGRSLGDVLLPTPGPGVEIVGWPSVGAVGCQFGGGWGGWGVCVLGLGRSTGRGGGWFFFGLKGRAGAHAMRPPLAHSGWPALLLQTPFAQATSCPGM